MSKNDIPPRITPSAVPDRLRNDGWWLKETCRPQRAPSEEVSVLTALMSVALVSGKLMPRSSFPCGLPRMSGNMQRLWEIGGVRYVGLP
ncbi:hypothetical protein ELH38_11620 [Rhizobium ruizarguesonis]|nr:hypothetical protein ELH38_11620 [Rhizobium ruizarguesonis]